MHLNCFPGAGAHGVDGDGGAQRQDVRAVGHGEDGGGRGEHDGAEDDVGADEARVEQQAEAEPAGQVEEGADGEQQGDGGGGNADLITAAVIDQSEIFTCSIVLKYLS